MSQTAREMPKYKCHKEVWALKIKSVETEFPRMAGRAGMGKATITPAEDGYAPFEVDADYVAKHDPQAGGYYVVYRDGYKSFSPASEFEAGYTLLP